MSAKHLHLLFHDAGTPGAVQGQLWKCFLRSKGNCRTRLLWDMRKRQSWPGELADVEAKPELGHLQSVDFYSRRGSMSSVLVWNRIFPIRRDFWNAIARQGVSSGMLQESRGTRAPSRPVAHVVPDLQHRSWSHKSWDRAVSIPLSPLSMAEAPSWSSPLWSVCFNPALNPTLLACRDFLEGDGSKAWLSKSSGKHKDPLQHTLQRWCCSAEVQAFPFFSERFKCWEYPC